MNIYDFFNSPDVAEHCQSIGHKLNAVESAVMVFKSKSRTIAEKHAAYKAIIAEHPDMELQECGRLGHVKSFHKALEEFVVYENSLLEHFLKPEQDAVYQYNHNDCDGGLFKSFEEALKEAAEVYNEDDKHVTVYKKYIGTKKDRKFMAVKASRSGGIIEIENWGAFEEPNDIYSLLDLYIDVPVPFKKGDLVEVDDDVNYMGDVYVLQNTSRDFVEHNAKQVYSPDTSDMTAWVFYVYDGRVDCESMHFYPDLRYCKRELKDEQRILKYISLYLQGIICLCNLLNGQKYLFLSKYANDLEDSYLEHAENINAVQEKYIKILENNPNVKLGPRCASVREVVEKTGLGPFTQYLRVTEVRPLENYKLWCRLLTGEIKIYDFTPQLEMPMFKHLKDKSEFDDVGISECGVPAWISPQNGIRDLELGITWILHHGDDVEAENT
jgi:hypothetical protein